MQLVAYDADDRYLPFHQVVPVTVNGAVLVLRVCTSTWTHLQAYAIVNKHDQTPRCRELHDNSTTSTVNLMYDTTNIASIIQLSSLLHELFRAGLVVHLNAQ